MGEALAVGLALAAFADGLTAGDAAVLHPNLGKLDGVAGAEALSWFLLQVLGDSVAASEGLAWAAVKALADGAVAGEAIALAPALVLALTMGVEVADVVALHPGIGVVDGLTVAEAVTLGSRTPGVLFEVGADADGRATHQVVYLVEGDRLPVLAFVLFDDEDRRLYLEGGSCTFELVGRDGGVVASGACVVTDWNGVVEYWLADGDTDEVGEFWGQVTTVLGGETMVSERVVVRVRERL